MALYAKGDFDGDSGPCQADSEIGRKHTVPYGLYCTHGFVSAHFAAKTGFSAEDLALLWEALEKLFWNDQSAARGEMAARKLVAFEHSCALGKAPAHELFERVVVERAHDGEVYPLGDKRLDNLPPTRRFSDYCVTIDRESLPEGVTIHELLR